MADGTVFPWHWTGLHVPLADLPAGGLARADYEMDPLMVPDVNFGPTLRDDFTDGLPTMSIVMNMEDLFNLDTGIYSNPTLRGDTWEKPCSVELINPDGTTGFQADCGIRIKGQYSSKPLVNYKHSFRLIFRDIYGDPKLRYKLFEDSDVEEFDHIALRGGANDSFGQTAEVITYTRDEWSRKTGLELGQLQSHGNFVHLYINGLYWGLFNPTERPMSSTFTAAHMGGEPEDWDVIKSEYTAPGGVTYDGSTADWTSVKNLVNGAYSGGVTNAEYDSIKAKVDVDNLIDYMLVEGYIGNGDWPGNNWIVAKRRVDDAGNPWTGQGFVFFLWDCEMSFGIPGEGPWATREINVNKIDNGTTTAGNPADISTILSTNLEYRMLFADRCTGRCLTAGRFRRRGLPKALLPCRTL